LPELGKIMALIGQFVALGLTLALIAILRTTFAGRKRANLPPGPKGKFLIGNLLDLPPPGTQEWQHWLKHKDLYGAVSHLDLF
jgi:hypothetical protein